MKKEPVRRKIVAFRFFMPQGNAARGGADKTQTKHWQQKQAAQGIHAQGAGTHGQGQRQTQALLPGPRAGSKSAQADKTAREGPDNASRIGRASGCL